MRGGVSHAGPTGVEKEPPGPIAVATLTSSSDGDVVNGGTSGKKSSFDRIVEKLGPVVLK